ncbi:hypothetical protein OK074_4718 [Actinobacteria bacterium OK074]|nr:hypothetical protein OK074_4718 [Actinobacteria bacterium OK074]
MNQQPGPDRHPHRALGRPLPVVAAVAAALLVVGGTVWAVAARGGGGDVGDRTLAQSGEGLDPAVTPVDPAAPVDPTAVNANRAPGEDRLLWAARAPQPPSGMGADAPGMWITGTTAVKAAYDELLAYGVADGATAWGPITFPRPICAVTPQQTSDDRIVVAYPGNSGDGTRCDRLQEVDLRTGARGWSATVDRAVAPALGLTLSGRTLVVGRATSGTAYDVDTGRKLWEKAKYGAAACLPVAFAGAPGRLLAVSSCGAGTAAEHDEVQELDPATGKAAWTRRIPNGWTVERTYSVDPVVLYLTDQDERRWNISVLDDDGTPRSQVHVDDTFAPECGRTLMDRDLQGCQGVAADADTLYLPTGATSGAGPNSVVAVDLGTGEEKWRVPSPGAAPMLPLRTADGGKRLIAYVEAAPGAGGRVVSLPTGGNGRRTITTLLRDPAGAAAAESGFASETIAYADSRFYISTTRLTGDTSSGQNLMLAYGK